MASKLTPKMREEICELVAVGHPLDAAAAECGVAGWTAYRWQKRGREATALRERGEAVPRGELPYLAFAEAVMLARGKAQVWLYRRMLEAAEGSGKRWGAYMTILERRFRENWAPVTGAADAQPQGDHEGDREPSLDLSKLSDEQLAQLIDLVAAAAAERTADVGAPRS